MRVLQVMAGDTHGGAENFFLRLVCALHNAGVSQEILIKPHAQREKVLRNKGIPVRTASFKKILSFQTRKKIQEHVKAFKPHILLSWMSRASALCPRGSFVHVGRLGGYYDLKYYQSCDYLIGNTPDIVDYFQNHGWPQGYTQYLPNFVSADHGAAKQERRTFDTPENVPLLLTLGRLHQDKAFDVLIRALVFLPEVYVWISGVGPELQGLKTLAQDLGVLSRIRWIGWHESISPLYKACDVYVCPSRIEPLGNVILEAWAHDKPVVAAKSKGPQSLISHQETGLLVDLEDPAALAKAIKKVLDSSGLQHHLVRQARGVLQKHFTQEKVTQQYMDFFKEILGKKRI